MNIAVIGAGHGGQALAFDLARRNCNVSLYASSEHPGGIHAVMQQKGIFCKGLINGFQPITNATTDLQEAVEGSEYIFIVLPSYAHEATFKKLLPVLKPGQTIVTLAANFSSLILLKLLTRIKKQADVNIIDVASLPFVCRADNNGAVEILAIKKMLAAASIPAKNMKTLIQKLSRIFPCTLVAYPDVLSLGMNMTNGIAHPVVTLLNSGRIGKNKELFYFYRDGITPEVGDLMERLDAERMQIGKKLGLEMHSFLSLTAQYYETKYESIYHHFQTSPMHHTLRCPDSLQHRFILEDVAGSLVAWYCLGKKINIHSPILEGLINLASLLNKTNYLHVGTNLVRLNLHDKNPKQIKNYIQKGEHYSEPLKITSSCVHYLKKFFTSEKHYGLVNRNFF